MSRLTDEMLMAYADGELEAVERERIGAMLDTDPDARERVELFIATRAPIAELYSQPMKEPVPPHLIALVMNHTSNGADIPMRRQRLSLASLLHSVSTVLFAGPRWQMATAWGAFAVVVGAATVGYLLHEGKDAELVALQQGQIIAQGPLKQALDTTPSGTELAVQTGTHACCTLRAVLTFQNRQQAFCRQYNLKTTKGDFAGIACRADDGQWRLEIHMAVNPTVTEVDRIRPAGSQAAAIESAVSNAMAGDALGPDEEKKLIGRKWTR